MLLYIISVVSSLIIATAVLLNNPKNKANIYFFLFVVTASLWLTGVFVPMVPDRLVVPLFKTAFMFSVLTAFSIYYFVQYLLEPKYKISRRDIPLFAVSIVNIFLVFTRYVTENVVRVSEGAAITVVPDRGPLYLITIITIFAPIVMSLIKLLRRIGRTRNHTKKTQLSLVLLAFSLAGIISFTTNVILTNIDVSTNYNQYSPTALLLITAIISYAMLWHHFFDMRVFAARATAYLLSLLILVTGSILILIGILTAVYGESNLTVPELSIVIFVTILFALTFHPVRLMFDRATNRIFFKYNYEPEHLINRLSSILAREIDLELVVAKSIELIQSTISPESIRFVVFKDGQVYIDKRYGKASHKAISRQSLKEVKGTVLSLDDIDGKEAGILKRYNSDIVLRLRTKKDVVGAVFFGPKKSGMIYNAQDIKVLSIMAKELAIAIQNSRYFEQIQEFNIKLQKEIALATAELRASNQKLKELDEAKDEFISMASHQLRTPLTSVKGYISMLLDGDAGKLKKEQKHLLEEAFASAQRMVYLIADLLNVSRLKTGKFVIESSRVSLDRLVQEEVNQLMPTAKSRKLKLNYRPPKHFPQVWLDETKTRQVIMNFIDNAIYYTPAGGKIDVILVIRKDEIEFKVKDTGIGVPKNQQHKLFNKFFRADNARRARPDGTGLGLYMARRIITAQGGAIIFNSQEGKGSEFGFSFSLKKVGKAPSRPKEPVKATATPR